MSHLHQPVLPLIWLDHARIAAIVAVVVLHVAADAVVSYPAGSSAWWIGNVVDSAMRWCVPVFVMISGALLLHSGKQEDAATFYRRRLARLLVPLVFWSVCYLAYSAWRIGLAPALLVDRLVSGVPYVHLWFLYMIVGLYAVTPVLRRLLAVMPRRELWVLTGSLFAVVLLYKLHTRFYPPGRGLFLLSFLPYLPYYLLGYLLTTADRSATRKPWLWYLGCLVLTAGGYYVLTRYAGAKTASYLYDYFSPAVLVMSVAVFSLMSRWNGPLLAPNRLRWLAGLTLGIYLVHPLLQREMMLAGWSVLHAHPALTLVPVIVVLLLLSALLTALLQRLPLLRRVI